MPSPWTSHRTSLYVMQEEGRYYTVFWSMEERSGEARGRIWCHRFFSDSTVMHCEAADLKPAEALRKMEEIEERAAKDGRRTGESESGFVTRIWDYQEYNSSSPFRQHPAYIAQETLKQLKQKTQNKNFKLKP